MGEVTLEFGAAVSDSDGGLGQLTRVLLDPAQRSASHIVVVPDDVAVTARLVPIDVLATDSSDRIMLMCSRAVFGGFEDAVDYEVLPYSPVVDAVVMVLTEGPAGGDAGLGGPAVASEAVIPEGRVGVSRDQPVSARDGSVGQLTGVVVDLSSRVVTHLLVVDGHLWSRRHFSLPMSAVEDFDDGIRLGISRAQASALAIVQR